MKTSGNSENCLQFSTYLQYMHAIHSNHLIAHSHPFLSLKSIACTKNIQIEVSS